MGISGGTTPYLTGIFAPKVPQSILLVSGQVLMAIGAILFALADNADQYWSHIVPGMILGMFGIGISYVGCTIVAMEGVRPGEEGIVSAVMYTTYQIGATLGVASELLHYPHRDLALTTKRFPIVITSIHISS